LTFVKRVGHAKFLANHLFQKQKTVKREEEEEETVFKRKERR